MVLVCWSGRLKRFLSARTTLRYDNKLAELRDPSQLAGGDLVCAARGGERLTIRNTSRARRKQQERVERTD